MSEVKRNFFRTIGNESDNQFKSLNSEHDCNESLVVEENFSLMGACDLTISVLEWDEEAVIAWLSSIGFPQYAHRIRAHNSNISGDILTNIDQDTLKEIGVETLGQRLAILKAVYYLKLSHNVPIGTEHYVPPSDRLRQLEYENKRLQSDLRVCLEELGGNVKTTARVLEHDILNNSIPRSENNEGLKDGLKSFKVSLEDPAWKVLPAALKKYKINDDDWQDYAMFICYGNTERCLSYDEKPLLLFQRLRDAKKKPAFMLKHIRDIRSPIVVAQQKQAARQMAKASGTAAAVSASTPAAILDTMTPSMEHRQEERSSPRDEDGTIVGTDVIPAPKDVSYAVAIYPYMAEKEDELDVVVGDTFINLRRIRGWWVVQRDPNGSGIVENDPFEQGWVPSGCLLETSVPVAEAVAEATGGNTTADGKPILPLSIISTSFPGIALVDYIKKGEELNLKKDDVLRVFKRYHHWSYVVKEQGGARGWVPSWYIGKVAGVGGPSTPNTSNSAGMQT